MTEKNFNKHVVKFLKDNGAYVIKAEGISIGMPDLICCINGDFIGIELKVPGKYKTTDAQKLQIKKIKESGGYAFTFTYSKKWREELYCFIKKC